MTDGWYVAGFVILSLVASFLKRRGERVGSLMTVVYTDFGRTREELTVKRLAWRGEATIKVQAMTVDGLCSVSLDREQARQLADILDAAAARSRGR